MSSKLEELRWKKFPVLNDGFVCLVDAMGDDSSVVQAARCSYGNELRLHIGTPEVQAKLKEMFPGGGDSDYINIDDGSVAWSSRQIEAAVDAIKDEHFKDDRNLIRYLMRHRHSTPFEMAEVKLLVRVPMDCWRQWIRHRTANVNEYSTRYSNAIDSRQTTAPDQWRSQSQTNKQGSGAVLGTEWPDAENWPEHIYYPGPDDVYDVNGEPPTPGELLTRHEQMFHQMAQELYEERLAHGVAKEQARKDLPLSTYTEAYWKCDLHNILHFLGLRMDSHAQKEIRDYATVIGEQVIKPLFPVVWEAFEDYRLGAMYLSRLEVEALKRAISAVDPTLLFTGLSCDGMGKREKEEFAKKLERLAAE